MPTALVPNRSDHAMALCYHRFSANGGIGSSRLSSRLESRGAQASFCRHKTNLNSLI